jgi:hypothetical protein
LRALRHGRGVEASRDTVRIDEALAVFSPACIAALCDLNCKSGSISPRLSETELPARSHIERSIRIDGDERSGSRALTTTGAPSRA